VRRCSVGESRAPCGASLLVGESGVFGGARARTPTSDTTRGLHWPPVRRVRAPVHVPRAVEGLRQARKAGRREALRTKSCGPYGVSCRSHLSTGWTTGWLRPSRMRCCPMSGLAVGNGIIAIALACMAAIPPYRDPPHLEKNIFLQMEGSW